jgi:hypothetical protein
LAGSVCYCLQDTVDIRQNLIVPEPEHSITTFLDSPAAKPIFRRSRSLTVLPAVELNY